MRLYAQYKFSVIDAVFGIILMCTSTFHYLYTQQLAVVFRTYTKITDQSRMIFWTHGKLQKLQNQQLLLSLLLNNAFFHRNLCLYLYIKGARSSVVGWGTMLQAWTSRVRVPMRWIFPILHNPSSHTMALGSTQPLTEMSSRNLPWG
jgi:hypothetical protein